MKKIVTTILIFLLIIILSIKFIPFGSKNINMPNSLVNLKVPRLSFFKEECCMFSLTFKSFKSIFTLKLELNNIMNKYEKMTCNNKTYYYDEKNNITISEYGVNYGFILNEFYITYDKGKRDLNECSKITDSSKIDYRLQNPRADEITCIETRKIPMEYLNEDGKTYKLYYDWCFGDLLFQTGIEKMNYLDSMLAYDWISMHDIIDFLEYQVENNTATKDLYRDGGSVLYKNKDFALLYCNTIEGNKDIYISDTNLEYENEYCK